MSTSTETTLTFPKSEARPMPTLICVGTVGEVSDGYVSDKSGNSYVVIPIALDPLDGGRRTKVYFTHRPEWLVHTFKPHILKRENASAYFVYEKNITSENDYSLLRGLAGSQDAFVELSDILLRLPVDADLGGPTPESVSEALRTYFTNNVDATGQIRKIGYELKQQSVKILADDGTPEIDPETGKPAKLLTKNYNVNSYWDVTEKGIKKMVNRANGSQGDVIMTYSGGAF
jgi:hypothetical protein